MSLTDIAKDQGFCPVTVLFKRLFAGLNLVLLKMLAHVKHTMQSIIVQTHDSIGSALLLTPIMQDTLIASGAVVITCQQTREIVILVVIIFMTCLTLNCRTLSTDDEL